MCNAPSIAESCRRLDGIPLAIELAAAQTCVLSVDEVAARLDHRFRLLACGSPTLPAHQQTLRAALDWSYDLLADPERRTFERLSVFAGGFTLQAAQAVCTDGSAGPHGILDLLTSLVDRSLIQAEPYANSEATRFAMLETLKSYAQERLIERGEVEHASERHARPGALRPAALRARPSNRTGKQPLARGPVRSA